MIKYLLILLTILTVISCETDNNKYKVEYKGALKNMMHAGDVSAKANLKDFQNSKHFYALGAFENLKGEIQIFNGEPFNTIVVKDKLTFDKSFEKKASLIVYASVNKWESIKIPEDVVTYEQLEIYIAQAAKEHHINIEAPFPFLIEGTLESFDWHVINWKEGDTEHSHEKHINSGLHGTIKNRKVEMLGFYSNAHHAIFTHHTTNMHIHVKTVDNKLAGHVDGLTLGKGMILKLPSTK